MIHIIILLSILLTNIAVLILQVYVYERLTHVIIKYPLRRTLDSIREYEEYLKKYQYRITTKPRIFCRFTCIHIRNHYPIISKLYDHFLISKNFGTRLNKDSHIHLLDQYLELSPRELAYFRYNLLYSFRSYVDNLFHRVIIAGHIVLGGYLINRIVVDVYSI